MDRPRWLTVLVLVVAAGGAGFALGRRAPTGPPVTPTRPPPRARVTHPAPTAPPDDRIGQLEEELAFEQERADALELELYGVPIQWPIDVPDAARPATFEANFRRLFAECGVVVDDLSFDCSEAPCFARFRRPQALWSSSDSWSETLRGCAAFRKVYEDNWTIATFGVACPDGSSEGGTILSVQPLEAPDWIGSHDDPSFSDNWMKRLESRRDIVIADWRCAAE